MQYAQSFDEFLTFAQEAYSQEHSGTIFINQTDVVNDEVFLGDEDTGRANVRQILSVLLETSHGSSFYEYTFFQPFDLEDVNEQLMEIYRLFPKKVVEKEEIEHKVSAGQNNYI